MNFHKLIPLSPYQVHFLLFFFSHISYRITLCSYIRNHKNSIPIHFPIFPFLPYYVLPTFRSFLYSSLLLLFLEIFKRTFIIVVLHSLSLVDLKWILVSSWIRSGVFYTTHYFSCHLYYFLIYSIYMIHTLCVVKCM